MSILKCKTTRAALISMILCLSLLSTAHVHLLAQAAQSSFPPTPLVVAMLGDQFQGRFLEGDVWAWGGSEWIQRTASGHTTWPIVSPSGGVFVYEQASPEYIKQISQISANSNNGDNAGNEIRPEDIYLWNFSTALVTPIAVQPWNASLDAAKARYTLRSEPSWSPDGKSLAWTEIMTDHASGHNTDLQDESLVVYDVAAHKATTIVPILAAHVSYGNSPFMSKVFFGPDGLLAARVRVSRSDDNLYFYNRDGQQLAEVAHLSQADQGFQYGDAIWLSGLDKAYLSCFNCSNKINPRTGEVSQLHGAPEMYSTLAPNRLSLYYGKDSGTESNTTWIIAFAGKQVGTFEGARMALLSDAAISPDGMVIAAAQFAGQSSTPGIAIFEAWNQHTWSDSIGLLGMGWGPTAWRVRPDSVN